MYHDSTFFINYPCSVCGETLAGGNNDVQTQLVGMSEIRRIPSIVIHLIFVAAVNAGLPTANANGQLTMTLHQINGGKDANVVFTYLHVTFSFVFD
jgi:hypothetical protein